MSQNPVSGKGFHYWPLDETIWNLYIYVKKKYAMLYLCQFGQTLVIG